LREKAKKAMQEAIMKKFKKSNINPVVQFVLTITMSFVLGYANSQVNHVTPAKFEDIILNRVVVVTLNEIRKNAA
jgi:ribosomal protein S3AE